MRDLLRVEWFKLRKGMVVKVLALVGVGYAVMIVGLYQMMEWVFAQTGALMPNEIPGMMSALPLTGLRALSDANLHALVQIFMLVLLSVLFAAEYSRSTLKILLVSGSDRAGVYLAKFALLAAALLAYTLFTAACVTLFATLLNGWGGAFAAVHILQIAAVAARLALLNLVYGALLAVVAILTKSTGTVIAIGIGLQFAESLVTTIIHMVDNRVVEWLSRLIPSGYVVSFANLTVQPSLLLQGVAVSLLWIALFLAIGLRLFRRQDIPV